MLNFPFKGAGVVIQLGKATDDPKKESAFSKKKKKRKKKKKKEIQNV